MKERLLELIASQFNLSVNDLEEDMSFQDDLNADSIELVELIMSIEDEFEIEIDDERLESLKTVGDVLEYVEELEQWYNWRLVSKIYKKKLIIILRIKIY